MGWCNIDLVANRCTCETVVAADCPVFSDCNAEGCHGNAQVPMKGVQGKAFSLVEVITEAYG